MEARRELERRLKPTLNGLILDLRDNAGGLIDQAVCVADLLLPKDEVVLEVKDVQDPQKVERIRTRNPERVRVPMVTLVNATTGSASEVLTGALQDHRRSLVVGELTFGKGTVQTVRPWQGSRQVMELFTAARYYRPSGAGVQLVGIEPDIGVSDPADAESDHHIVLRERDLFPTALPAEPEVWNHPDPALAARVRECTEESGLAAHRQRRDARGSRAFDYVLAVGQDTLVCSLKL
jgi:carboxyl-terminal processing protease